MLEADGAAAHFGFIRPGELGAATDEIDPTAFAKLGDTAGELANDFRLYEVAELIEIELGLAEIETELGGFVSLADDLSDVQERFAGNAAAVQADAAQLGIFVDQNRFEAMIGGVQGGGISSRAAADDE
jgi:hypothetical protein